MAGIRQLANNNYVLARAAGSGEAYTSPIWSTPHPELKTYLSWLSPVNRYVVAVTGSDALVGLTAADPDSLDISLNVRKVASSLLNDGQAALITLFHDTKVDTAYSNGIDFDEWGWLVGHLAQDDFWELTTIGGLWDLYSPYHSAVYPAPATVTATVYDSLATANDDTVMMSKIWWVKD